MIVQPLGATGSRHVRPRAAPLLAAVLLSALHSAGSVREHQLPPGTDLEHIAAPWVSPPSLTFPYQGLHNRLRKLLELQAERRRVSVTFFTAAQQPMLLNCLYSLVKYGKVRNYVVVVVDPESLTACLSLKLPCYNASHLLGGGAPVHSTQDHTFGSASYRRLVHLKPAVVHEVFRLGLTVHFTDVDVSYLRAVWPSYERLLAATAADAAFMNEDGHLNSGNFVFRYNERTEALVTAWAAAPPERDAYLTDQEWLWSFRDRGFRLCGDPDGCAGVKAGGAAAVALHPSQFGKTSWTGHCAGRRPWRACDPAMLYLHVICYSGQRSKVYWMKFYDLWHLDVDDFTPLKRRHPYLPCAEDVAWLPRRGSQSEVDKSLKVYPKVVGDSSDDDDVKNIPLAPRL